MAYVQTVTLILSILTVAAQVLFVVLGILLLRARGSAPAHPLLAWVSAHALWLMLIVALTAMGGSLFLSDIAGWTPCKLCWYQRILMYPQVFLLALALWKKDRTIAPYILLLSALGAAVALWHWGEQVSATLWPEAVDPNAPCDITGTSCRTTYTFRFGYITIPMMAFSAFLLNAIGAKILMKVRS